MVALLYTGWQPASYAPLYEQQALRGDGNSALTIIRTGCCCRTAVQMLMTDNAAYYLGMAQQLYTFLTEDPEHTGIKQLQLADSGEGCSIGLRIACMCG